MRLAYARNPRQRPRYPHILGCDFFGRDYLTIFAIMAKRPRQFNALAHSHRVTIFDYSDPFCSKLYTKHVLIRSAELAETCRNLPKLAFWKRAETRATHKKN